MKKQRLYPENYIILPATKTRVSHEESPKVASFLTSLSPAAKAAATISLNVLKKDPKPDDEISVKVLDSIETKGPKLISIDQEKLADFRFSYPGLRIIPERFYRPPVTVKDILNRKTKQAKHSISVTLRLNNQDNEGIEAVPLIVFTDYKAGEGASGVTDSEGKVTLKLSGDTAERIYIYPVHSY